MNISIYRQINKSVRSIEIITRKASAGWFEYKSTSFLFYKLRFSSNSSCRFYCNSFIPIQWFQYITSIAQLSQRHRAGGWASSGQKWKMIFRKHYTSLFNHCDVVGLQRYRIRNITAITQFNVIQGHRCRYQSKASKRLPISD